jgi:ABC-type multidrug transport system ATPase subunit
MSARVDVAGLPDIEHFSAASTGKRVAVLGAPASLFHATAGLIGLAHGALRVSGMTPGDALRSGRMACVPRDVPLPPRWSPRTYVTRSAELGAVDPARAAAHAAFALDRMELARWADRPIATLPLHARRALNLAAALAVSAETLVLEDPLADLDERAQAYLAGVVARALAPKEFVLFAARLPLSSPIAVMVEEALVVRDGAVAEQGPPAALASRAARYSVRVTGQAHGLSRALTARGAHVRGGGTHLFVDLGPLSTLDLLGIAAEENAIVVELSPLARAFT